MKNLKTVHQRLRFARNKFKRAFKKRLRHLFEFFGLELYSKPARYALETKLAKFLPEKGFFVEAGAADGYTESNTYYLEKFKGWRGILVEPVPEMYEICLRERRNSTVFNCALVSEDFKENFVTMRTAYLMSTVSGALESEQAHLEKAYFFHGAEDREVSVPARTLSSILEEVGVMEVDFLSLDVEGYELQALKGLNFQKHKPAFLLIECLSDDSRKQIEEYISPYYTMAEKLTKRDFLYKKDKSSL